MKLVIILSNGKKDACGDCEMVSMMMAGHSREKLEKEFGHKLPNYYFELEE